MTLGHTIKYLRDLESVSQHGFAIRSGVPIDTLKRLEQGKRKNPRLSTLRKIASAFDITLDALVGEDKVRIENERHRNPITKSVDELVALGDSADARGEYDVALRHYYDSLAASTSAFQFARILVGKFSQMYINKLDFSTAASTCASVEYAVSEFISDPNEQRIIRGLIMEKKGWIAYHQGNFSLARNCFNESRAVGKAFEDRALESTSHHFIGNTLLDQYSRVLFDEIPELSNVEGANRSKLERALADLDKAAAIDTKIARIPAVGFNLLRASQGLLLKGSVEDAKHSLTQSRALLKGHGVTETYPLVELQRIATLTTKDERELAEICSALEDSLQHLMSAAHPHSLEFVRALVVLLCAKFRVEDYQDKASERRRCADLAVISLLLYFEPLHPLFKATNGLLARFIYAMEDAEFSRYVNELEPRIQSFADDFKMLKKFPIISSVLRYATLHEVINVSTPNR